MMVAFAVSTGALSAADAPAQSYPAKPIRLVVGFSPGGTTDILAREIAARMQESWGKSVVVENRPGAGANIASEVVAKAPPDGYTLLVATNSIAINPAIYTRLPFDPFGDFAPITFLGSVTNILIAHPSLPAKSIKELIALARAKPREVTYGSGGIGTAPHLAVELFATLAKIELTHVPYKGVPPVIQGLLSGEVALGVASLPSAGIPNLVKTGKVRGLALTADKRARAVPSVPTIAESGFPGFDVVIWYGMLAPAGAPADIIARLNKELVRIMGLAAVRERMAAFDFVISTSSPEEFGAYFKRELAQWAKVVKEAGIKPVN
jgi:tripartite-type tricarboxylate transporter receptor subunit TctC